MNRKFFKTGLLVAVVLGLAIGSAYIARSPMAAVGDMTPMDLVAEAREEITTITIQEAKKLFDGREYLFLDVRTAKEFKMGHVPGAKNISRGVLEFKVGKQVPDKAAKIVVYCKTGGRSSLATYNLYRMGYKNLINMDGGWMAWMKAGYPVE